MIRAADLVVQDEDGAYFRVEERQLLLPQLPPAQSGGGRVMNVQLVAPGEGVLSYLTQGVTWKAQYTLEVEKDGAATLTAYAVISNQTDQPFVPDQVMLLAGEVQLRQERWRGISSRQQFAFAAASVHEYEERPTPHLAEAEEMAGLYRFELAQPPALPGNSTLRVPFQPVNLQSFETRATLNLSFHQSPLQKGVLNRHYRLCAAQPLLEAVTVVREQNYIVGQTQWTETAAGQEVTFELGRDPDVTYTRTLDVLDVQVQTQEVVIRKGEKERKTLTTTTYQVTYLLRNAKARPMAVQVREQLRYETIVSCEGDARLTNQEVWIEDRLEGGEEKTLTYELVLQTVTQVEGRR